MQPRVSIITVVRNAAELLEKTILCVKNQTYPNIEYLIIDGNSTDATLDVIKKYEAHISHWISEPDKNLYDAMNKGLRLATGDFVWFLHAGDLIPTPQSLALALKDFDNEDFIYGDAVIVQKDGSHKPLHKNTPHQASFRSFRKGMVICHQAMLVRRSLAPAYDLRFTLAGDIDWAIRVLKKTEKTRYVGFVLAEFLTGGISSQKKKESLIERYHILRQHFGFFPNLWAHVQMGFDFLKQKYQS
jgi:glycosyltransferase involved in cell wall biosynthesis